MPIAVMVVGQVCMSAVSCRTDSSLLLLLLLLLLLSFMSRTDRPYAADQPHRRG
jgi:hypothetical protein